MTTDGAHKKTTREDHPASSRMLSYRVFRSLRDETASPIEGGTEVPQGELQEQLDLSIQSPPRK